MGAGAQGLCAVRMPDREAAQVEGREASARQAGALEGLWGPWRSGGSVLALSPPVSRFR